MKFQDFEATRRDARLLGQGQACDFAASGNYEIKYLPYNWGLNDEGPHGRHYSRANLILDNIFK